MRDYEVARWETEHFEPNLRRLRDQLSSDFAAQIDPIARRAGPLHVCLARASHDDCTSQTPYVIASFVNLAGAAFPGMDLAEVCDVLSALLRWDWGMEALRHGLGELDASCSPATAELAAIDRETLAEAIRSMWLIGLLRLAYVPGLRGRDLVEPLSSSHDPGGCISVHEVVAARAQERFEELWCSLLGEAPGSAPAISDPLWQNALAMASRHKYLRNGQCHLMAQLLRHVARGGAWPLPCAENEAFVQRACDLGCAGFWKCHALQRTSTPFRLDVDFVSNPLEILNLGNCFDTCLRLNGPEELKLLGWATNANIRVIAARGSDGRILGRGTIALSLEGQCGVLQCPTYPKGHTVIATAIDSYAKSFACRAGLQLTSGAVPETTCAPPYLCDFPKPDACAAPA